jgi:chloride channel protein, CIC family
MPGYFRTFFSALRQRLISRPDTTLLLLISIGAVSVVTGLLVAFFLWSLDAVTHVRFRYPWLLFGLPVAGLSITWLYRLAGKNAAKGNDLIIDEIHKPGAGVPARMTPLILITTLITHLFGGSAGREGTAVQMGGGISAYFARLLRLGEHHRVILLMCGVAAGFGAVFGTPLAGTVFAVEVLTIGAVRYRAAFYCLVAAFAGDLVCRLTGVHHTTYELNFVPHPGSSLSWISQDIALLLKCIAAGAVFGCASRLFSFALHFVKSATEKHLRDPWLRPVVGGLLVIGITFAIGNYDYLGLGVSNPRPGGVSILAAFEPGGAQYFSWFWKLLLTVVTLGFGFKGGEVTPLFFVGATLGNVVAVITGAPVDLFAAIGFLAVFAGATNTPIACTLMGMELFGPENTVFYAVACFTAYFCSGHKGIYSAQQRSIITRE